MNRSMAVSTAGVFLLVLGLWSGGGLLFGKITLAQNRETVNFPANWLAQRQDTTCPAPALARFRQHRVVRGETIATLSQRYRLTPATLQGFNPVLRDGSAPVGAVIQIPPHNGIQIEVRPGTNWNALARAYGVRADVLYEVNGCLATVPRVVFVPGVNWTPNGVTVRSAPTGQQGVLRQYPLPAIAPILNRFGWRSVENGGNAQTGFHSGVDLAATAGTTVFSSGDGVVAFAGVQGDYGNLVVINHADGLQTRYAQLATVSVQAGQRVQPGQQIGTVGNTGQADRSHLHFEVRFNSNVGWVAQDPGEYFREMQGDR